jgi:uncharacterized membrane protein YgcG
MIQIGPRSRRRPFGVALVGMFALGALLATASLAAAAGPPFPPPETGVRIYDTSDILSPASEQSAQQIIAGIEARTGAQVVVYTQDVESGRTPDEAEADARALMDQWGVGRKGFDDGLVILFDMYPGREHGQVQLYAGPGFAAEFLDNAARQRIYENDMLPQLRDGDFDGALLTALERVDAVATPEHAADLQRARQIDAVLGLLVAPLIALLLIGWAAWSWLRYGRDPVYLDDPSVHMAGPPEALTPAAAVFVLEGRATRAALTTAMLDLASRGRIAFREEHGLLGTGRKVGVELEPAAPDAETLARQRRNEARPLGPAEEVAERRLRAVDHDEAGYIDPKGLLGFGAAVPAFDTALENEVVARGWFGERPSRVLARWSARGVGVGVLGGVLIFLGLNIPFNGLLFLGIGLLVAGVAIVAIGRQMPSVTLPGAMIRAMMAAYRRTLRKTMDQARSMDQVVAEAGLPWLETPDQAVVWATALGLHREIETVLERSLEDEREGRVSAGSVWMPAWYGTGSGSNAGFAGAGAGGGGGLFSSSAVPNIGGMMAALGTIGNSPSSSGSGGGGGFGGGGSGGGGGGAGGGF